MTAQQDLKLQQTRSPEVASRILNAVMIAKLTGLTDREIQKAKIVGGKLMRVN